MMIRLNGAFGARKTQMAYALRRRLPGPHVYDSENAGYFLRANLPPTMPQRLSGPSPCGAPSQSPYSAPWRNSTPAVSSSP